MRVPSRITEYYYEDYMGRILVRLDLLPSLRGIPWVPHRQAPEHFMVELWKPRLVLSGPAERNKRRLSAFLSEIV